LVAAVVDIILEMLVLLEVQEVAVLVMVALVVLQQ
jgi:hypothetical protein